MTSPEHKMSFTMQRMHIRATVSAGAVAYRAQSPFMLAAGRNRSDLCDAHADADEMDAMLRRCPPRQWGACAQAMMAVGSMETSR